ncbi:ABC transporter permease [Solitalea canadensis]|uniref:ABC-type multidrug transport system, permease component n=1 Tax=Solitalea canadensis (strain ATCC 29591 / DSM 3403 / JCM 21819 / LMG 8368 / NBRC 15130 / NCIMB 12057 / USAM 9D) TaxID=929556 RepID=H8KRK1_SOLCM|nr:ABC transporter permease [Solitalea canadensis]AFD07582.1 ABC-type multidrug transport system, permease component [Solitalea canadensis DSM 3403]
MRTILFLLQKEFKQIFRNKALLPVLFAAPIIQLIILPLAANYEVKNISIAVVDHDRSPYSQKLISKIIASGYFKLTGYNSSFAEADELIKADKADLILEIPARFERDLVRNNQQQLFVAVNAINGTKANLGGAYLGQIIAAFNNDIRIDWIQPSRVSQQPTIEIASSNWFNPLLNYRFFMVPGILAVLVTMIAGYMSSLNIVKEKEIGTIEQINVTPIRKHHFILGKLIPFWVLGMFIFSFGLFIIARFIYGIIPVGNILLLYAFLAVYLLALLGFGLLISTYCDTQQQAMSVAFFFVMIFMLMSGLFTPIESMPEWAKWISRFSPVTYFIEVMRMVVLKGSGFNDIKFHFLKIIGFAIVLNSWAIWNYRKTS